MSIGPITRIRDGQANALDGVLVPVMGLCVLFGLVLLLMTLLAYRRDPCLRDRKWPSPGQAPGLSRRVKRWASLSSILALGLVLLIYTGWGAALFVTGVLGGLAVTIDRLDLFTDDGPAAPLADAPSRPEQNTDNSGR